MCSSISQKAMNCSNDAESKKPCMARSPNPRQGDSSLPRITSVDINALNGSNMLQRCGSLSLPSEARLSCCVLCPELLRITRSKLYPWTQVRLDCVTSHSGLCDYSRRRLALCYVCLAVHRRLCSIACSMQAKHFPHFVSAQHACAR
jgi:hypothetical protein